MIGAGVVGSAIAYELAAQSDYHVIVFEQNPQDQWHATGAALGILTVGLSRRRKGRNFGLRQASLQRYTTLIPELEDLTQQQIPYNRHGILELCFNAADWQQWQHLAQPDQDIALELLNPDQVGDHYPMVAGATSLTGHLLQGGILCRSDRQVDPLSLTQGLREGAKLRGAQFYYNTSVTHFSHREQTLTHLHTPRDTYPIDAIVLAAGLGTTALSQTLGQSLPLQPVLGQALCLRRDRPHGPSSPVIQGEDVHIVPIHPDQFWVGATVEFNPASGADLGAEQSPPVADPDCLRNVHEQAIALCPSLASATILHTWHGLRPRPENQAAPVIQAIKPYTNAWWATGHYRNGILLAPITALRIRDLLAAILPNSNNNFLAIL